MNVVEIFPSFQGEGVFVGEPVVFLRLGGCNLNCEWCDTKNVKMYNVKDEKVIKEITKLLTENNIKTLVITGGEPTLQYNSLLKIINIMPKNIKIQIETNGYNKTYLENVYHIISPKEDIENVFNFYKNLKNTYFKFVIANEQDLLQILNLLNKYNYRETVWLQPEFSNDEEIAKLILKNIKKFDNIKLSAQVHKYLNFR